MSKNILANNQAYQSIYINPEATNWQETIVFHDPIFDDEIPGVVALKSLRLENCLGFVLGAPKNRIRYFREKVKDLDTEEQLGQKQPRDILKRLLLLADEIGGTVVYIQQEQIEEPQENIDGIKGPEKKSKKDPKKKGNTKTKQQQETDSFFDPLTKRKLIVHGPQYFDDSLPTINTVETSAKIFADIRQQNIVSPDKGTYPDNLNPANTTVWDNVVKTNYNQIHTRDNNKDKWSLAKTSYEFTCSKIGVRPYTLALISNKESIKQDIKQRILAASNVLQQISDTISEKGFTTSNQTRLKLNDVLVKEDCLQVVANLNLILTDDVGSFALGIVQSKFGFQYAITKNRNILKQLDDRTNITLTEYPWCIEANVIYDLPFKDAEKLFDSSTEDKSKLRLGVIGLFKKIPTPSVSTYIAQAAIDEEKAIRMFWKLFNSPEPDQEMLLDLIDEKITSQDALMGIFNALRSGKSVNIKEHIIKKLNQKDIIEKINSDAEGSTAFIPYISNDEFHKIELPANTVEFLMASASDDITDKFFQILGGDLSSYTDSKLDNILKIVDAYDWMDSFTFILGNFTKQKRYEPIYGYIPTDEPELTQLVVPYFEEICQKNIIKSYRILLSFCDNDKKYLQNIEPLEQYETTINELLGIFGKYENDQIREVDGTEICALYISANEKNQKLNIFYKPFVNDGVFTESGREEPLLPYFLNNAKDPDFLITKMLKCPIEGYIYWHEKWVPLTKTKLWNEIYTHFSFEGSDDFAEYYKFLNEDQKKYTADNASGSIFEFIYEVVPSFRGKALEVAFDEMDKGDNEKIAQIAQLACYGQFEDIKKIYDKVGLLQLIKFYKSWGKLDDIKYTLEQIMDINTLDYEKLYSEASEEDKKIVYTFCWYMGQYNRIWDWDYDWFIDAIHKREDYSDTIANVCNSVGAERSLILINEIDQKNRDKILEKIKPLFESGDIELALGDFEDLLKLYQKDTAFCAKLIDGLSDEDISKMEDSANPIIKTRIMIDKNPKEYLNILLKHSKGEKVPEYATKIYVDLLGKISPRLLREFCIAGFEITALDTVIRHIIVNYYPEDYWNSSHTWAFKGVSDEKKEQFVKAVGEENLTDRQLESLFGKVNRFERKEVPPKLQDRVVEDKLELLRLLLPLAKPIKA